MALSTRGHRGASSPQGARPLVIHETWAYARPGSVRSGHPAPLQAGKRVQSCPRPRARRGGGLVSHGAWGCLPRTTRPVKGLPRGLLRPPPPLGPISAPRCCHSGGRHHRGEMPGWVQGLGRCRLWPAILAHPSQAPPSWAGASVSSDGEEAARGGLGGPSGLCMCCPNSERNFRVQRPPGSRGPGRGRAKGVGQLDGLSVSALASD